jgi:hypothetical protein
LGNLFDELLPTALFCNVSVFDFWDMTFGEIVLTIQAYNRRKEEEMKAQCISDYNLADLIALSCARLVDKDLKFPKIEQIYPQLFTEKLTEEKKWKVEKARIMDFAIVHNGRMNKEEKHD